MDPRRKLKKSESLEIRLPHPTKLAFMDRCRADGRSASEALRGFIEAQLEPPVHRPGGRLDARAWRRIAAGAFMAGAVGALAVPSFARPGPPAAFERLDLDGDAGLTLGELSRAFVRLDADHDGRVTAEELRQDD